MHFSVSASYCYILSFLFSYFTLLYLSFFSFISVFLVSSFFHFCFLFSLCLFLSLSTIFSFSKSPCLFFFQKKKLTIISHIFMIHSLFRVVHLCLLSTGSGITPPIAASGARMAIVQSAYVAYRFGGYSCTVISFLLSFLILALPSSFVGVCFTCCLFFSFLSFLSRSLLFYLFISVYM